MNKRKYIFIGTIVVVFAVGVGAAYYIAPEMISSLFGMGTTDINADTGVDLSATEDASSSFFALDSSENSEHVSSTPLLSKKVAKKPDTTTDSGATTTKESAAQPSAAVSSPARGTVIGTGLASGDGAGNISSPMVPPPASVPTSSCVFPSGTIVPTRKVIFNEIAWMGSPSSSNAEWIELKNNTDTVIDLSGWTLMDASGKIKIFFSDDDKIVPKTFFLLSRGSVGSFLGIGSKTYSGDLVNSGDDLVLMDPQCAVADRLDASKGWPEGSNTTKQTLERAADGIAWHASALPGGTPGAENSAGPPPVQNKLVIAFEGSAGGGTTVTSVPDGLVCGMSCVGNFASGTKITLTPTAGQNTAFGGWSGLCYGETVCSFVISANVSLAANFHSTLPAPPIPDMTPITDADISSTSTGSVASSTDGAGGGTTFPTSSAHVLIAALQVAGAASGNDFVKLFNPTAATIDIGGWKLRKRSQAGSDYSLKVFPSGSTIAAGETFVWANSAGGFSEMLGANVSSTETLSADNSVALFDAAGSVVDAVAWGTGANQYGEGPPYPTSPAANQLLSRRTSGGIMVDTGNNTNDFVIQ